MCVGIQPSEVLGGTAAAIGYLGVDLKTEKTHRIDRIVYGRLM